MRLRLTNKIEKKDSMTKQHSKPNLEPKLHRLRKKMIKMNLVGRGTLLAAGGMTQKVEQKLGSCIGKKSMWK